MSRIIIVIDFVLVVFCLVPEEMQVNGTKKEDGS